MIITDPKTPLREIVTHHTYNMYLRGIFWDTCYASSIININNIVNTFNPINLIQVSKITVENTEEKIERSLQSFLSSSQ